MAFQPGCGCRNLVRMKFAKWIRDINSGKRIGLFLSDINGAFDRGECLDSSILALKCAKVGFGETVCKFIGAWLVPRKAHVIVQGQWSEQALIENQVYQGTVLGPALWNLLFSDVSELAAANDFTEVKFADDLTCDKAFPACPRQVCV